MVAGRAGQVAELTGWTEDRVLACTASWLAITGDQYMRLGDAGPGEGSNLMAANYPGTGDRSTGMTTDSGQADASCLSADCGGTPAGLEAPGGSLPDDDLGGYCSTCRFWLAKAGEAVPGTVVAVMDDDSRHHFYFNLAEPIVHTGNPSLHLGFGGAPWRVSFLDGRVVETNDLYGQGEIPARFHHLFPLNATLEQFGYYDGGRIDNGPPFHLLALDFPAGLTMSERPSVASGSAAAREYGRGRKALVLHLAGRHGLVGYDPFPLGTDHAYPTDPRGNVLVHDHDLAELLSLHDRGAHGPSTHQHDSPVGQEGLGPYVSPEAWRPAAGQARADHVRTRRRQPAGRNPIARPGKAPGA